MILGFKTKFQNGTPTYFKEKIQAGFKKHTFRNGNRWKAGMQIHMATGVRTKNYDRFNDCFHSILQGLDYCKSVQTYKFEFSETLKFRNVSLSIDGRYIQQSEIFMIAKNDGFETVKDFVDYFFDSRDKETNTNEGQIIHWTNIRY